MEGTRSKCTIYGVFILRRGRRRNYGVRAQIELARHYPGVRASRTHATPTILYCASDSLAIRSLMRRMVIESDRFQDQLTAIAFLMMAGFSIIYL